MFYNGIIPAMAITVSHDLCIYIKKHFYTYYKCWKQLRCLIFGNRNALFQDYLIKRKFIKTAFIDYWYILLIFFNQFFQCTIRKCKNLAVYGLFKLSCVGGPNFKSFMLASLFSNVVSEQYREVSVQDALWDEMLDLSGDLTLQCSCSYRNPPTPHSFLKLDRSLIRTEITSSEPRRTKRHTVW